MLEPSEPSLEVAEWLSTLRLSQYVSFFLQGGYQALEDCKNLTDEHLMELKVLPTGHRRRILRSLEALGLKQQSGEEEDEDQHQDPDSKRGQRKPAPYPRHVFLKDRKRGTSCQQQQPKEKTEYEGSRTLPAGAGLGADPENHPDRRYRSQPQPTPRNPQNIQKSVSAQTCQPASTCSSSSSSSSEYLSSSEIPSDWEVISEEPLRSNVGSALSATEAPLPAPTEDSIGFHGDMVDNLIYEAQPLFQAPAGPRLTRSYRLRHRPVPEIPNQTILPLQDRSPPAAQPASPEHLTGSEAPTGANGVQKAPSSASFSQCSHHLSTCPPCPT